MSYPEGHQPVCFAQVWDGRKKQSTHIFQNNYQVTACTFNDTAEQVITGGIDNDIKVRQIMARERWWCGASGVCG